MKKLAVCMLLLLAACGRPNNGDVYVSQDGPTAPVVSPTLSQDIASLIADENSYREGLGQTELSSGLSCTLYTITGGQFIQNDATHTPTLTGLSQVATFLLTSSINQPNSNVNVGLNVLPAALKANPSYQNLIKLRCTGQLVVTEDGWNNFDLASDDGSVLYVSDNSQGTNNTRVIDNDGNHGIVDKVGQKYLRRGVHSIELDFAQTGAGSQALILKLNGSLLDPMYLFH